MKLTQIEKELRRLTDYYHKATEEEIQSFLGLVEERIKRYVEIGVLEHIENTYEKYKITSYTHIVYPGMDQYPLTNHILYLNRYGKNSYELKLTNEYKDEFIVECLVLHGKTVVGNGGRFYRQAILDFIEDIQTKKYKHLEVI